MQQHLWFQVNASKGRLIKPSIWSLKGHNSNHVFRVTYTPQNQPLAPENGGLEDDSCPFLGAERLFSGAFAVSFREGNHISKATNARRIVRVRWSETDCCCGTFYHTLMFRCDSLRWLRYNGLKRRRVFCRIRWKFPLRWNGDFVLGIVVPPQKKSRKQNLELWETLENTLEIPGSRKTIYWMIFRKDYCFSARVYTQKFQGTIILMVFDFQGIWFRFRQFSKVRIFPKHLGEFQGKFAQMKLNWDWYCMGKNLMYFLLISGNWWVLHLLLAKK